MTITDFLTWLMGGGCLLAASWLLERFPAYTNLPSNIKEWIFFGVAVVLGGLSFVVSTYVPAGTIEAIAPYFGIVASVFSYIFLGKSFHRVDADNRG
jgi:drug/metabolite transporter (DMT)-like permease